MKERILAIDTAKGIGMFLVFHGHLIQRYIEHNCGNFRLQIATIYLFHVPLFFFISGMFQRTKDANINILLAIWRLSVKRLVPVLFFNIVGLLVFVITDLTALGAINYSEILNKAVKLTRGFPVYNYVTWFVICLFICELIHMVQVRLLGENSIIFSIPFFLLLGSLVSLNKNGMTLLMGIPNNFWFIESAFTALVFYQISVVWSRDFLLLIEGVSLKKLSAATLFFFLIVIVFAYANIPYTMRAYGKPITTINGREFGNFVYFYGGAFSGIFLVFCVARILKNFDFLQKIGGSTLILLGLQGLIHRYINPKFLVFQIANNAVLFLITFLISAATLALSYYARKPFSHVNSMLTSAIINIPNKTLVLTGAFAKRWHR